MSSYEYAMSRVQDALEKSGGNHLKAQRLVLQWVEKDQGLLLGLVAPHLHSIVSHAVNHVDPAPKKKTLKRAAVKQDEVGELGAVIAQSLKGGGLSFGQPAPKNLSKPGKASKTHVDAINKLISAGQKKDTKKK